MGKIGRNQPCPCGSGKKFKHCCLHNTRQPAAPKEQIKVTLMAEIAKIQQAALAKKEKIREQGVFILFSNNDGDAWLLEVTDSDAVQVARAGEVLDVPIDESPETIEVDWSHIFKIRDRQFYLTAYADKLETRLENVPTKQINAAIRRILKRCSPEMLEQVHVNQEESGQFA
ncbi:MAG: hypothetical protein GQ559_09325 [Desulfobulbaceae bacterium]|nr:hypothetical protein [Desulfobulbaceae bacterium]